MIELKLKRSLSLYQIPALGSLAIYVAIAYFLERQDSFFLITGFVLLFLAYFSFLLNNYNRKNLYFLISIAVIFRLSLFFSIPNLSNDFYRFIWDGRLIINGIHPFSQVPSSLLALSEGFEGINESLYLKLNSPHYFTIYPPVCQAIFASAAYFFPSDVEASAFFMRFFIIAAEIGSIYLMIKILNLNHLPEKNVLIYALNPLVIIELTGNLHFEALMIFFLLMSLYMYNKNRLILSALFFSLAVCTKLIPLIFLPLFIKRLGTKNAVAYFSIMGSLCFLMFLPLLSVEFIKGFSSSFLYYFSRFEFNASVYYLIREAGRIFLDMNVIVAAGAILSISIFLLIMLYAKKENTDKVSIYEGCMWVLLIYLLLSTTLHPWYVIPLLSFSVFTTYRFTIVWSFLIFFTYLNYSYPEYYENLWVVFLEYFIMLIFLVFELKFYPMFQGFKENIRMRFLNSVKN